MPCIDALVSSPVVDTFRVRQVDGMFDLPRSETSSFRITADLPGMDEKWKIGAIVGPSGSGKSVLACKAYAEGGIAQGAMIERFDWDDSRAIVDNFGPDATGSDISRTLSAVGFSSPPSWVRPYRVLSNGEKFRCDLARALLLKTPLVVVDEFTSVVDRQVAHFASAAVAKTIRKNAACKNKKFVAVSCHHDILDWLCPDWVFDTSTGTLHWGSVQRPDITLTLHRGKQRHWRMFEHHHYLSASLSPAARCYLACWNERPIGFVATMHQGATSPRRRVHRLVILPDYQGMGIGPAILQAVAVHEAKTGVEISIVTSHPVLIRHLDQSSVWKRARTVRLGQVHSGFLKQLGRAIGSQGRATASFLYQPAARSKAR